MKNSDVIEKITDKIIEKMESGKLSWNKPWTAGAMPQNFISKKAYRGWNLFATMFNEFESPYYLTFNQVKKLKGSIKKGSVGTPIVFWSPLNKTTKDENNENVKKSFLLAKSYTVFNAEQIEGIDFGTIEVSELGTCEELEQAISEMDTPVNIKHGISDRAFYTPTFDYIQMPNKTQFKTEGEYYSTLVHEVIHSTGHKARLNRLSLNDAKFDSKKHSYSYEELVAELGASYLTAMFGVATEQTQKNSAAYLQGWLSALKADKQMLYKASADAQKAVDYIVKKAEVVEVLEEQEQSAAA